VSVKEQRKFYSIEQLLGKEVTKIAVPESIGEQPAYTPSSSGGIRSPNRRSFYNKGSSRHK